MLRDRLRLVFTRMSHDIEFIRVFVNENNACDQVHDTGLIQQSLSKLAKINWITILELRILMKLISLHVSKPRQQHNVLLYSCAYQTSGSITIPIRIFGKTVTTKN